MDFCVVSTGAVGNFICGHFLDVPIEISADSVLKI